MPAKKVAAPKEGTKKEDTKKTKLVATVMESSHGFLFTAHKHYHINVIEVPVETDINKIEQAGDKAARTATKLFGKKTRLLATEEIEIASQDHIRATVEKFLSTK